MTEHSEMGAGMRDRLIRLINHCTSCEECRDEDIADYLLSNGVIVPPCKVGDTIYLPWEWKDTRGVASGVAILTVERMSFTEAGCSIRTDLWYEDEDRWLAYNCGVFKFDEIGKTVFLTREEAEKALAERSNP